jgi:hypothetical protein
LASTPVRPYLARFWAQALHLDLYPTGRDDALPLERRIEIVEAKVAELVGLGATVEHRTEHDDQDAPFHFVVMHDSEGNEFCVS